jgi:hypothetical protein
MAGSLELIKSDTVTSAVSTVLVTDVFSANFDVYKVTVTGFELGGSPLSGHNLQFINSSGSTVTSSNYDSATLGMKTLNTFSNDKTQNGTTGRIGMSIGTTPNEAVSTILVFNPFSSSSYTFYLNQSMSWGNQWVGGKSIGVLKQTSSITGIAFTTNTTKTLNNGTVNIYGVK